VLGSFFILLQSSRLWRASRGRGMRKSLAVGIRFRSASPQLALVLRWSGLSLLSSALLMSTVVSAQDEKLKNELEVGVGRTFISDQRVPNTNFFDNSVHSGKGLSFNFLYARQLRFFRWADSTIGIELPVIYNPDEDLNYGLNVIPKQYSSIFATPAVRVTFIRNFFISPWVSLGGGIGYFSSSKDAVFFGPYTGHRIKATAVMHGGIGFDVPLPMKLHSLRFRFEVRDNWSGVPPINLDTGRTRQHNYYVGGGVVMRF